MPPSLAFLNSLRSRLSTTSLAPDVYALISVSVATSCAKHEWVPAIYKHAVAEFPLPDDPIPKTPQTFADETLPRRRIVRRLKEALFKCIILCGVSKVIEASLALKDACVAQDRATEFVRDGFDLGPTNDDRGEETIRRVYKSNLDAIFQRFGPEMEEIKWLSKQITYGLCLGPTVDNTPTAPLTFQETEIVILCCLISAHARREVLWHLRGARRSGLSAEEVETIQQAIELVAKECGNDVSAANLPRVQDVTEEDDLS